MKKILLTVCLIVLGCLQADAQQIHQLTQYTLNNFAFNPAIAGSDVNNIVTKASSRIQWWGGFDGAEPQTILLSTHTNFGEKKKVGLGAMIFADKTGPTSRVGINAAYAYHIPINGYNSKDHISLGISGTLMQYAVNFEEISLIDQGDIAAMDAASQRSITGDINFGAYAYGRRYWIGFSALQLVQSQVIFNDVDYLQIEDNPNLNLSRHYYLGGGYQFKVDEKIRLEPSALLKYVAAVPLSFELNVKASYINKKNSFKEAYWVGLGYRHQDAFSIMLGVDLDNGLNIAYSYDLISSTIRIVSNGSHELTLGYDIYREKDLLRAKPFDF